jgi:hypothetical protein
MSYEGQTNVRRSSNTSRMDVEWTSNENITDIERKSNERQLQWPMTTTADNYDRWLHFRHIAANKALQIARDFYNNGLQKIFFFPLLVWCCTWPSSLQKSSRLSPPLPMHNKWWSMRHPLTPKRREERSTIKGRRTHQQNVIASCYDLDATSIETSLSSS